jgi:hypothetical protein
MNQKGNEFKMEKHLLVTYSWSMNNIGDIGITPGLLHMIGREKEELPVKVFAWQTEDDPAYAVARDYLPRYKKNCEVLPMPFFDSQGDDAQESGAWLGLVSRWGKSKLESFRKGTLTSYESALLVEDILERFALDVFEELKREKPEAAAAIENAGFVYYNSGTTLRAKSVCLTVSVHSLSTHWNGRWNCFIANCLPMPVLSIAVIRIP